MIELHIYVEPLPGKERELETLYWDEYVPAISIQEGFVRTTLLKYRDAVRRYQIDIAFDTEELRVKWAASKEHRETWPKIEALCARVSWSGFDAIEKP